MYIFRAKAYLFKNNRVVLKWLSKNWYASLWLRPIITGAITSNLLKAREKSRLLFQGAMVLLLIGWDNWHEIFKPITRQSRYYFRQSLEKKLPYEFLQNGIYTHHRIWFNKYRCKFHRFHRFHRLHLLHRFLRHRRNRRSSHSYLSCNCAIYLIHRSIHCPSIQNNVCSCHYTLNEKCDFKRFYRKVSKTIKGHLLSWGSIAEIVGVNELIP